VTSGIIRTTTSMTHRIIRTTTTPLANSIIRATAHMTHSIIRTTTSKANQRSCGRCSAGDACTRQHACQRDSCNLCFYLHYDFLSLGSGRSDRLLWELHDRFDYGHARWVAEGLAQKT
jgi:hypothetical protein